jgi:hypothetical protein
MKTHERNHGVTIPRTPDDMETMVPAPLPAVKIQSMEREEDDLEPESEEEDVVPPGILSPGGYIEEFMAYADRGEYAAPPLFSMAMGMCLIGVLMGEKVVTETWFRTNMYFITLARSGTGKEGPMNAAKRLMADTGTAEDCRGPTELTSAAALLSRLRDKESQLLMLDEIGDFVGAVKNRNSFKSEMIRLLKELSTSQGEYSKGYTNTNQTFTVPWHNLCLYGTGVPSTFWNNLTMEDLAGGFVPRCLILSLNLQRQKDTGRTLDRSLSGSLLGKTEAFHKFERKFKDKGRNCPNPRVVAMTAEAREIMKDFTNKFADRKYSSPSLEYLDGIYNRLAEHAKRMSLVFALSRCACAESGLCVPDFIDTEDVLKATDFMEWHVPRFIRMVKAKVAWNPRDALKRRLLAAVQRRNFLPESTAYLLAQDCGYRDVKDALDLLLKTKEIVLASNAKGHIGYVPRLRPRKK